MNTSEFTITKKNATTKAGKSVKLNITPVAEVSNGGGTSPSAQNIVTPTGRGVVCGGNSES
jgi:hypothetical protein